MNNMQDYEYKCIKCKDIWGFDPDDYDEEYPHINICPFCDMSIFQMIGDIWRNERWGGIPLMIKILLAKF